MTVSKVCWGWRMWQHISSHIAAAGWGCPVMKSCALGHMIFGKTLFGNLNRPTGGMSCSCLTKALKKGRTEVQSQKALNGQIAEGSILSDSLVR